MSAQTPFGDEAKPAPLSERDKAKLDKQRQKEEEVVRKVRAPRPPTGRGRGLTRRM
jgi:hypothetical protein